MSINIKELSEQDLKWIIEDIKVEREKADNALKRYEEELERRKREVPLGVPSEGKYCVLADGQVNYRRYQGNMERKILEEVFNTFSSYESGKKHAEMLLAWRKALVANAKGEPIDIKVLLPLLPKGWVAMNEHMNKWVWYEEKPVRYDELGRHCWESKETKIDILPFNIKPAKDWRNSLMKCGL